MLKKLNQFLWSKRLQRKMKLNQPLEKRLIESIIKQSMFFDTVFRPISLIPIISTFFHQKNSIIINKNSSEISIRIAKPDREKSPFTPEDILSVFLTIDYVIGDLLNKGYIQKIDISGRSTSSEQDNNVVINSLTDNLHSIVYEINMQNKSGLYEKYTTLYAPTHALSEYYARGMKTFEMWHSDRTRKIAIWGIYLTAISLIANLLTKVFVVIDAGQSILVPMKLVLLWLVNVATPF